MQSGVLLLLAPILPFKSWHLGPQVQHTNKVVRLEISLAEPHEAGLQHEGTLNITVAVRPHFFATPAINCDGKFTFRMGEVYFLSAAFKATLYAGGTLRPREMTLEALSAPVCQFLSIFERSRADPSWACCWLHSGSSLSMCWSSCTSS